MKINVLLSMLIISLALTSSSFAQPELDTTYNSTGKASFTHGLGGASDTVVQNDKKIILVGTCSDVNLITYPFCLLRVNENGTYDTSYSVNTFNRISVAGASSSGSGMGGIALQSDGKLVLAGYSPISGEQRAVLVRLNTNGSFDSSFGTNGIVASDLNPGSHDLATNVAVQPNGKIVVVGYYVNININEAQFVARYNSDGTLDGSFGTGGIVRTSVLSAAVKGRSVALQQDGRIVVGGLSIAGQVSYMFTRLNSNGTLDNTWDGDGIKYIPYGTSAATNEVGVKALAIQLDGQIVALGQSNVVYRLNTDGSLDTSFDGDGSRATWTSANHVAYDLMVTAAGKIIVTGNTTSTSADGSQYIFTISKFRFDGSPDTSFSGDGYFTAGGNESGRSIAMDPTGRLVSGGFRGTMNTPFEQPVFFSLRLSAPPSQNVQVSGRVTNPNGMPVGNAVVILQDSIGNSYNALTNPFGYYLFSGIPSNRSYAVSPGSKKALFPDRSIFVDDTVPNLNITTDPPTE